ncbi:septation protein imp2 [Cryptococcus neoformans var. grubii Br795]|nr:septation protein imp2 [Cryptococcus neoformans var. grubii AD1-83a]OXG67828.1 septation protein imp2 [Cryptococcus neoformans var. grubii MW-RSA1955]OXG67869.1 septation protein imp2 [Cryptococcus neoformans var. grubii c8]OXG71762.1 septation protein imp2 [Cryptococcus neoformans var. grubii CHC193]OXG91044.1 septation protein imp2 [Cryptococcus neoformans var. grubii Br795]OXG95213.1 septation protein imp2 [Cryptococcus neoformans var. grubii D17-1]OXG99203.1 septation protein imp2 [Cry
MAQSTEPLRSQSSTSLYRLYNGPNGGLNGNQIAEEELHDPRLNYCNAFWGPGDRGFDVIMARLRGAGRTVEELRAFWKERAAIEDEYAKKLNKLSRFSLGKDEIGDLADSLQHLLSETAQQASYHSSLSNEIRQTVENPSAELGMRMSNLKKGLQAAVEKAYKNKGLQEGHVQKARDRYEEDCLKLNSYTAQSSLTQGKELEKLHTKLDRVRQTIGANENDFKQFVKVLEVTHKKWEQEWKNFCDHVQDLEEDRMAITKDLMWVYANAVSQVCVEDDSSCERIREKLEQFEPINDIVNFAKGWGTGDMIPDPPRFINYSAGESYPTQATFHIAQFMRISAKPPMPIASRELTREIQREQTPEPKPEPRPTTEPQPEIAKEREQPSAKPGVNDISDGLNRTTLKDGPVSAPTATEPEAPKVPFGGVALPGMSATSPASQDNSSKYNPMPPPPVPATLTMPEPRVPSRQGPPSPMKNINDEEDPMAKALADLRRDPPPPGSVRRNASHRRAESVVSAAGSVRSSMYGHGVKSPASPAPNRMSFQQSAPAQSRSPPIDSTLSPPPGGHTAAALAKSMDEFRHQSSRGPESKRQSVNYSNFADDVVGSHPTSRPTTPSFPPASPRAPSPAMMQAPKQPATHIADEVLSQYHQAFPGERETRSRSRAGSIMSNVSRNSYIEQQQHQQAPPSPGVQPRQGFVGIGAGNAARSPSPQPPVFRSPDPSPVITPSTLGPQNLGISLDAKGGVAQDTMAEQYRRQYQQQQAQAQAQQSAAQPTQAPAPQMGSYPGQRTSQYGVSASGPSPTPAAAPAGYGSAYGQPSRSPAATSSAMGPPAISGNRPTSGYGQQQQLPSQQAYASQAQSQAAQAFNQTPQPAYNQYSSPAQQQPSPYLQQQNQAPQPNYSQRPPSVYGHSNAYDGRGPSPQLQQPPMQPSQQPYQSGQPYGRSLSSSPAIGQGYGYQASPQQPQGYMQQQQQHQQQRTPSPQPNQPPPNMVPTGQWSTTGLPVMFYVKALYDYSAQTAAEFDFQAGDIIAVTSTPEDGWWSGELLDEARRTPGRTDFPSNFVTLF